MNHLCQLRLSTRQRLRSIFAFIKYVECEYAARDTNLHPISLNIQDSQQSSNAALVNIYKSPCCILVRFDIFLNLQFYIRNPAPRSGVVVFFSSCTVPQRRKQCRTLFFSSSCLRQREEENTPKYVDHNTVYLPLPFTHPIYHLFHYFNLRPNRRVRHRVRFIHQCRRRQYSWRLPLRRCRFLVEFQQELLRRQQDRRYHGHWMH